MTGGCALDSLPDAATRRRALLDHDSTLLIEAGAGSGKTRTVLKILTVLRDRQEIDTVVITMDETDLLNQWFTEMLALRGTLKTPVQFYRDYDSHKEVQDFSLSPKHSVLLVMRRAGTVGDPLVSALRQLTPAQKRRTLLIHDEVHRLGSPDNRRRLAGLADEIRFRLGLSATPEREYDNTGNDLITEHIGPELFRFEPGDAIRRGFLAPFNYFPLPYQLTDDDRARVRDVYRRKAARAAAGEPMTDEQVWTDIANVYKTSRAKLPVFEGFIARRHELLERCIIFVETQEYGYEILDIVHKHRADFHTCFSGEQSGTLRRFAHGDLECLITCHRVSEGIDIRSLSSVILFSSARARLETIQRMGRCLRSNPDDPEKFANVAEFIRQGDEGDDPNADEDRCAWLTELSTARMEEGVNEP